MLRPRLLADATLAVLGLLDGKGAPETFDAWGYAAPLDRPEWRAVRDQVDAVWFPHLDDAVRRERLVARHVAFGKTSDAARECVDEANARAVAATRVSPQRSTSANSAGHERELNGLEGQTQWLSWRR